MPSHLVVKIWYGVKRQTSFGPRYSTCLIHLLQLHILVDLLVCILYLAQKYLSFMLKPEESVRVVTMKGLRHVDTKNMDAATYLNPNLYPGMPTLTESCSW